MNLPNKLTLSRIFMIPVFVAVFYLGLLSAWCYLVAAVIFVLAAATDALDGHIARSRNLVTNLGKFLDPIADKVLVSTAFIVMLTIPTAFTVEPFGNGGLIAGGVCIAVILARELIVSGFRMVAAGRNLVLAADKLGKIKTTTQDIAIVLLLVSMAFLTVGARAYDGNYAAVVGGEFDRLTALYRLGEITAYIGLACFALCTFFTVLSGVNYIVKNKEVLREETNGAN